MNIYFLLMTQFVMRRRKIPYAIIRYIYVGFQNW